MFTFQTLQRRRNRPKTLQPRFQILNNFPGQLIRLRQIVQIGKALVLEPENFGVGCISHQDFSSALNTDWMDTHAALHIARRPQKPDRQNSGTIIAEVLQAAWSIRPGSGYRLFGARGDTPHLYRGSKGGERQAYLVPGMLQAFTGNMFETNHSIAGLDFRVLPLV